MPLYGRCRRARGRPAKDFRPWDRCQGLPNDACVRRILIEHTDGAARDVMARALTEAGYAVETCRGPAKGNCPLVNGGDCPMAQSADVIVCGLHLANAENRAVLHAHEVRSPGTPVIVEASAWQAKEYATAVRSAHVVEHPLSRESLVDAVRHACTEA